MELLISIMILGLVVMAMVRIYWLLEAKKSGLERRAERMERRAKVARLLYEDLQRADKISFGPHERYAALAITGGKSLFGIERPYVLWYVSRKDKTLCRIESAVKISFPLDPERLHYVNLSPLLKGCESFIVTADPQRKKLLVGATFTNSDPIYFALRRPKSKKKSKTLQATRIHSTAPKRPAPVPAR